MGDGGECAMDGRMAAQSRWAMVAAMGDGGGDGQQEVSQLETATAGAQS